MPPKQQQIQGRLKRSVRSTSKRAGPPSSETTNNIAGDSKATHVPAVLLCPNPEPRTASPVRSVEVNGLVLDRNDCQNCSTDRDGDVIVNRNRNDESLIRNSELVVDRDEVDMDVDVSGGDVEGEGEKKAVKKKKTKVVKVVKKVVRVVKKRVPVRKGRVLIASDVQNSGGGSLLPAEKQEINRGDDNVVEEGEKFESLASRLVEDEDHFAGQDLAGGEVRGSGGLGSVSMEEQETNQCVVGAMEGSREYKSLASGSVVVGDNGVGEALVVEDAKHSGTLASVSVEEQVIDERVDQVVEESREIESLASSPVVVGDNGLGQVLVVEDANHSEGLASVYVELENSEKERVCEMGEKEGAVEKCESVDMVVEREASIEHENRNREEVAVEDDGDMTVGGIALSRELEAMERRKRRKTEIFVGGLHLSVKEEDLRKVFEDVGEIVQVRLVLNFNTGKNRGFAFVRFASAADAKKALEKYPKLEVNKKFSFSFMWIHISFMQIVENSRTAPSCWRMC